MLFEINFRRFVHGCSQRVMCVKDVVWNCKYFIHSFIGPSLLVLLISVTRLGNFESYLQDCYLSCKSSPNLHKVAQKVFTYNFYLKSDIFQNIPKSHKIFGLLLKRIRSQEIPKIAQSGHTGHKNVLEQRFFVVF